MIRALLAFIALTLACTWAIAPSKADIQKCVDSTNYTAERCRHEITR